MNRRRSDSEQIQNRFKTDSEQIQNKFRTNSEQIQNKFRTNSEQIQNKFRTNSEQIQNKFRTNSEQIQNSWLCYRLWMKCQIQTLNRCTGIVPDSTKWDEGRRYEEKKGNILDSVVGFISWVRVLLRSTNKETLGWCNEPTHKG